MEIHVLAVGALQTNCYLIDTGAGNAIIVDPGANPGGILEFLSREHLRPVYLIYTHGHYDHIGATTPLRQAGAKAILPREDRDLFLNPALIGAGLFTHFRGYTPEEPDLLCGEGDKVELDGLRLTFLHTPGHSKGSSVLMGDGVLFTGDTLFAGGCGRTDLYGGSEQQLNASLKRLAALEGDYQILPGHGPQSMLSVERITNPYLGTSYDDIF
ncbi:MAG: MBL fold metallo-hydrolase [Oscillospiraceae bacterium]|jgi:hydroxyacylglutathione hydrolase|nr:MBL fold metallo-hydrolase [Oscillospiraceae bacterium]